jgi:hypothetical protein
MGVIVCLGGTIARAEPPAGAEAAGPPGIAQPPVPQGNFFSSLKQAFKQDFDHEVVRAHFDVGTPPDVHRYYCLVDPKTGKREPNGVAGQPVPRADGMTGIKASAVSLYSCDSAQQQGILVGTGYVLSAAAGRLSVAPAPLTAPPAAAIPAAIPQKPVESPGIPDTSPDRIDVAGVKLGMSPDEVRSVLRSKNLPSQLESTETLTLFDAAKRAMQPIANARFVNVIAAWTPPPSAAGDAVAGDAESFEIMFTPVPGQERAMAIIHSTGYSTVNAVREATLDGGLVRKYGGFSGSTDLPVSPTWRVQSGGTVQTGDPCERRGLFAGLGAWNAANATRANLALRTTPDEFQFQVDHCGVAIVTEDHSTPNAGAPREQRLVTRFTVTAYSPRIGFEGATKAAQLIRTAEESANTANAGRTRDPAPDL